MRSLILALTLFAAQAHAGVTVGFSHGTPSARDVAVTAITEAQHSILLAAYQFTSEPVIRALLDAKKRGVDVQVLLDRTQRNGDSQATMVASGVPCYIDQKYRIMHHKFMVIDGTNVETGSFNYSLSADKSNAENALLVRNDAALAQAYAGEWQRLKQLPTTVRCAGGGQ